MTDTPQTFSVDTAYAGTRLDMFLTEHIQGQSRSALQKLVKTGAVLVDGKSVTPHHFLKGGETVTLGSIPSVPVVPRTRPTQTTIPAIDIIAEEKDYIVVNKPAGILVHPLEHVHEWSMIDQLLEAYPDIRQVGEDPMRPGIVHRLDRDVSGVMVVARTWEMYESLKDAFARRTIHKEYTALVHGIPAKIEGEITFGLARSTRRPGRIAAKPEGEGKAAITKYEVVETFASYALLNVILLTGRTHQIRAHLRAYGYPIVGDQLYHARHHKKDLGATRPMLCSTTLGFTDLKGKEHTYTAALPDDFKAVLEKLRNK